MIKIYQITEIEWVASSSKEGAIQWLVDCVGVDEAEDQMEDGFYPVEISQADMDRHKYIDDTVIPPKGRTFSQELWRMILDDNVEFPCFFACSEC